MLGYEQAHRLTADNRGLIAQSDKCGCFRCLTMFSPASIRDWVDRGQTALCPRCGDETVLPDGAGVALDAEFLRSMRQHWLG